ncbi:conserved hypothetical protein [Hyella patelloides LEGE 07179]|uniref:Uncharacterized protein n=1 Tax=Hyella patelloides LEGE 07179 TaxID=945734 RepID=A0A563W212_9CYAN|nr:hypothetical protein [Hyella patelloides]VEP17732.1 conserved hypothetical protein [Hyella patelloides LEGE 07179]
MFNYISNSEATELLFKAIKIHRYLKLTSESTEQNINLQTRFRQIGVQLQNYTHPINDAVAVEQIPLKIRRCFVRAVMLLTRYPQLGGQQTGGTYKSQIVSSYRHDSIPNFWYEADMVAKLCRLFQLSSQYAKDIKHLLTQIDRQIARQQQIIQALTNEFNRVSHQKDVLRLFQSLFGDVTIPETSINCLTTKMQIAFVIDYHKDRLQEEYLWQNLSPPEQQTISCLFNKISQFSWQQFARFPSFGYVKAPSIDSQLLQRLVNVTGYNKSEIVKAIATSVTVVATERAESFLLHDIWGHYWQSILTQFSNDYTYLSQIDRDLNLDSSVKTTTGIISLQQLFRYQNGVVNLNKPLAQKFFHSAAKKRLQSLSTHLIGEMLADINEYKWLSQNYDSQDLLLSTRESPFEDKWNMLSDREHFLPSTSYFKDFPTKLDLTIQDLEFLYLPLFETLIKLPLSSLETELINKFQIKDRDILSSLRLAISDLNQTFITEYIKQDRSKYNQLILKLLRFQTLLNKLYTKPHKNTHIPFQDLIILFVGNYYCPNFEQDIASLNLALANYFFPCWLLLKKISLN